MKRLLLVLISSMALSCWAQTGVDSPKAATGTSAVSGQSVTIRVQPGDQPHQLALPTSLDELQSRLGGMESPVGELETVEGTQAGCPVQIVDASFERAGQLMFTSQSKADSAPTYI